jgi:hypothetical protein
MFVDPYGPRRPLAVMRQEPYPTNADALLRVLALWGRNDFNNPFILDGAGVVLWNATELLRMVTADQPHLTLKRILEELSERNGYILHEFGNDDGDRKRDNISLKDGAGKGLSILSPSGYSSPEVTIPRAILEQLIRHNLVRESGRDENPLKSAYVLTASGIAWAKSGRQ